MLLQMPNGFFWELPAPHLPLRASGALVMDATGMVIANCPNASYADAIALHINVANGVHGPTLSASISSPSDTV